MNASTYAERFAVRDATVTYADDYATQYERTQAIHKATRSIDADDLATIAQERAGEILEALIDGDEMEVGRIFAQDRIAVIADRASMAVYGKPGFITTKHVGEAA